MNPLNSGLKAVKEIKKNKLLFVILITIQILFMFSVSFVGIKYQAKIYGGVNRVIEPLESIDNLKNSESREQPALEEIMEKISVISKNYQEMVRNILKLVFLALGCFFLLNGLNWSIANYLVKRGSLVRYWGKFILVNLVFLVPLSLISYLTLKNLIGMELESFKWGIKIVGWVFLVISYFMLIGFCLVEEKLKLLLVKTFLIGIKKAPWALLSLLCCLSAMLLCFVLIYFSTGSFLLTIISGLILVVVLVLGKLFLIGAVKELNKKIY